MFVYYYYYYIYIYIYYASTASPPIFRCTPLGGSLLCVSSSSRVPHRLVLSTPLHSSPHKHRGVTKEKINTMMLSPDRIKAKKKEEEKKKHIRIVIHYPHKVPESLRSAGEKLFDELLLRMSRVILQIPQDGAADDVEPTPPAPDLVHRALADYFKEAAQRQRRVDALAISREDLFQILHFGITQLYAATQVTPSRARGHLAYDTEHDFMATTPTFSISALRSGLRRQHGPDKGAFILSSSFTEVVELCRAVDLLRHRHGHTSCKPVVAGVRLSTFLSVAATLLPVVRLWDLIEAVTHFLSKEVYMEEPDQKAVVFACAATMFTNWSLLDTARAAALRRVSDAVMAALNDTSFRSSGGPVLHAVVQSAVAADLACAVLRRSYPDPVMAAEIPSLPHDPPLPSSFPNFPPPPTSSPGRCRPGRRAQEAEKEAGEGGRDGVDCMRPPNAAAEEKEEEELPPDTIDYGFWSAMASQPTRLVLEEEEADA
eukprot:gene6520-4697_t